MCGEPRDVRLRRPRCWFFLLAQVCPAAMPPRALSLRRVNVHGSLDRVKDTSRDGGAFRAPRARCPRLESVGRRCSPPRRPEDIRGHRRARPPRRNRDARQRADQGLRSDDAPRRAPPSRRPGCLPPSRTRRNESRGERFEFSPAFAPALPLTPPTLFPQVGESALIGHCKCHGAVTRAP